MWKINCPLLLNHERTVMNHIILESRVKLPDLLNQEITEIEPV